MVALLAACTRTDETEAFRLTRQAADQGDAEAQHILGRMYYSGDGIAQDLAEAVRWCRKAAEQGHAEAQCQLGSMYDLGYGVRWDEAEAVRWFLLAAEQGVAQAQYRLWSMYASGRGVPLKDPLDFLDGFKHIETPQTTVFSDVPLLGSVLPV